jgi:hypothetical protein
MRHAKPIFSLSMALFAGALAACGTQVEIESKEVSSVGALEKGTPNANGNPGCIAGVVQRSTCVDPGELKYEAYEICLQASLTLTDLQYEPVCDGWKTDSAQYECCPTPPEQPVPQPSPPSADCTQGTLGDGQTCQNMGNFKTLAYDACAQAGLMLYNIYDFNFGSCNTGEGLSASYDCCPAPPPPPPSVPPVVCLAGSVGDGQTCQNLGDFKMLAYDACSQAGLMLFDITISDAGSCNASDALLAEYKCTAQDNVCP